MIVVMDLVIQKDLIIEKNKFLLHRLRFKINDFYNERNRISDVKDLLQ